MAKERTYMQHKEVGGIIEVRNYLRGYTGEAHNNEG